jgi:hypothetical protein
MAAFAARRLLPCASLLLLLAAVASAQQGEVCERPPDAGGPVSLVILASDAKVRALAASVKDTPVVARDAHTVIFADGRVITADVASAGDHLNALGWGHRRIDVSATFPAKRARPRSSYG